MEKGLVSLAATIVIFYFFFTLSASLLAARWNRRFNKFDFLNSIFCGFSASVICFSAFHYESNDPNQLITNTGFCVAVFSTVLTIGSIFSKTHKPKKDKAGKIIVPRSNFFTKDLSPFLQPRLELVLATFGYTLATVGIISGQFPAQFKMM